METQMREQTLIHGSSLKSAKKPPISLSAILVDEEQWVGCERFIWRRRKRAGGLDTQPMRGGDGGVHPRLQIGERGKKVRFKLR